MEEWRHWLEGSKHPVVVLTDHMNLEYLRSAKRLNPRQSRWALFLHICISLSHIVLILRIPKLMPCHINTTAQAQVTQRKPFSQSHTSSMGHYDRLDQVNLQEPSPPEFLPDKTFVPQELRRKVIQTRSLCAQLWSPWDYCDSPASPEQLLMANHENRHNRLYSQMFHL